ncbi:MAG: hypothetical protein A3I78_10180 [Gammaproteobacteria bacterium RIFCSPLOWO2_02_FULL_56_15]|nr:MAG: hypothetical protein A3I78_10180 [Gammaproteobacteria bacterium RIFCSPLOWO2_02_FULL_56_15]
MNTKLVLLAAATLVINIPFGYWREGLRKFSVQWFIAVHAAVPVVITLRILAGIEWRILTIAFLVVCYFLGQFSGARLRRRLDPAVVHPNGGASQ